MCSILSEHIPYLCVSLCVHVPRRLLRQHLPELGEVADQSLEALGLYKPDMASEVVRLQPNTPTLLAYKQLADAGVTGAPVVSPDGQLIANLSISDIRCAYRMQHVIYVICRLPCCEAAWQLHVCGCAFAVYPDACYAVTAPACCAAGCIAVTSSVPA
jgi:hypothetical protein